MKCRPDRGKGSKRAVTEGALHVEGSAGRWGSGVWGEKVVRDEAGMIWPRVEPCRSWAFVKRFFFYYFIFVVVVVRL